MTGLNLPKKCGVMLLPDCSLFPHGGLPLFIFEERYRIMLEEAIAGDCVFAVGRIREEGEREIVSPIGTAGLIRASREQGDGTSQLLLHGVIRVRFTEWLDDKPYPCALIEPVMTGTMEPKIGEAAMKTLKGAVEDGITGLPEEVQAAVFAMLGQADEAGLMADLVAQQFVHDPDLRQELLETTATGDRVRLLCEFFAKLKTAD
jgi:Lon protease-like protein